MTDQQERKIMLTMERMAKSMERIADVLETPAEPLIAELGSFASSAVLSWQDAVRVLKDTCIEAPECGPGCIMYEWCQNNIPETETAPSGWFVPGAGE